MKLHHIFVALLLMAAWGAEPSYASVAFDTSNANSSSGVVGSETVTLTCSAGDDVLLFVADTAALNQTVSGGSGCTWALLDTESTTGVNINAYVAYNVAANTSQTITVTAQSSPPLTGIISIVVQAFSGAATSSAFTSAHANESSQTTFTATVATPRANCLVTAYAAATGSFTWTAGTGYTIPANGSVSSGTFTIKAAGEYATSLTASASNVSPTITLSSSQTGSIFAIAIAPPLPSIVPLPPQIF